MRYFSISWSEELSEIGHYPQTNYRKGYNPTLPNSHWQVKHDEFPDFSPNYELELHPSAVPTNFIDGHGGGYPGFLVDSKFKNILQEHKLPPHQFYPIKVYHKDNLLDYYWFHYIVGDMWESINMAESEIRIQFSSNMDNKVAIPMVDRLYVERIYDHFENNIEYNVLPEKIILNENFRNVDMINLGFLNYSPLISHKLRTALENGGMTGYQSRLYKPLNAPFYKSNNHKK